MQTLPIKKYEAIESVPKLGNSSMSIFNRLFSPSPSLTP